MTATFPTRGSDIARHYAPIDSDGLFHLQGQHDQQSHGNRGRSSWRGRNLIDEPWWIQDRDGNILSWYDTVAVHAVADYAQIKADGNTSAFDTYSGRANRFIRWASDDTQATLMPVMYQLAGDDVDGQQVLDELDDMYEPAPPPGDDEISAAVATLAAESEALPDPDVLGDSGLRQGALEAGHRRHEVYQTGTRTERALASSIEAWSGSHDGVALLRNRLDQGHYETELFVEAIRTAPPTSDWLYRGMTGYGLTDEWDSIGPGDTIGLDDIGSFTENMDHARTFGNQILLEMEPGAAALPIAAWSNTPGEQEWLIAGDVEVVSTSIDGPTRTVTVRYVGDADSETINRAMAAAAGQSPLDIIRDILRTPLHHQSSGTATFHLEGTPYDHDQSSHGRGRRLADAAEDAPDERGALPDDWFADEETQEWAFMLASDKALNVPKPTKERIRKNRRSLRKSKRPGGELRGNSYTRRARAEALFEEFGGKERGWCPCVHCGIKVSPKGRDGYAPMQQDKILTVHEGGTYGTARSFPNLIPSCGGCNSTRSDEPFPVRPEWETS